MTSIEKIQNDFSNKKVLIFGLGILGGGVGVVKFLNKIGSKLIVTDLRNEDELASSLEEIKEIAYKRTFGRHTKKDIDDCDIIIRNPGVPRNHELLKYASSQKKPIFMEAALFAKYTQKPIIGITGTRGKTTTTWIIKSILENNLNQKVQFGGNIPGKSTIEMLETEDQDTWGSILELSSWQLQGFNDLKISPHISILTNIYEDHLNRYKNMKDYIDDKTTIFKHQKSTDYLIFNQDNKTARDIVLLSKSKKIGFTKRQIDGIDVSLIGDHNRENIAAAIRVSQILKISDKNALETVKNFKAVPYRLEKIRELNGVAYINDTTSTTPVALLAAIKSMSKPTVLIMGGNSKNLPTNELVQELNQNKVIKKIILVPGSGTEEIKNEIDKRITLHSNNLHSAVEVSEGLTNPGDVLLFSPGFTSFSQFKNEFDRGDRFNQIVKSL
ncbi:UDP-N-acetylmuramoyl-L-alanine--D-glutamate ligase [Patescibacteria group bacterium]